MLRAFLKLIKKKKEKERFKDQLCKIFSSSFIVYFLASIKKKLGFWDVSHGLRIASVVFHFRFLWVSFIRRLQVESDFDRRSAWKARSSILLATPPLPPSFLSRSNAKIGYFERSDWWSRLRWIKKKKKKKEDKWWDLRRILDPSLRPCLSYEFFD